MKRISNSSAGILGGFVFVVIGIVLLWWNEGNNVKNLKTTGEMDKVVVDVGSNSVDLNNDGKLIATHGKVINEQELVDSTFNVKVVSPIMKRVVEVYQWEENSSTDDDEVYTSKEVGVGAFKLSSNQIETLSTKANYSDFDTETISKLNLTVSTHYLTNSKNLENPNIGDTRISFVYNNSAELSVLAVQQGNTFVDFVSSAGKSVNRVMDGTHSGHEMINVIKSENNFLKWLLRFIGTILCIGGIGAILKPISAITSYIPIQGSLVGAAVGLVSFVLGLALSLIIIAVAWIRFRPILGICLLAIVTALIVFLIMRSKK